MFKKKLCYFPHPMLAGHATLNKPEHKMLARKMGLPLTVDSATFEKISGQTKEVNIYWKDIIPASPVFG